MSIDIPCPTIYPNEDRGLVHADLVQKTGQVQETGRLGRMRGGCSTASIYSMSGSDPQQSEERAEQVFKKSIKKIVERTILVIFFDLSTSWGKASCLRDLASATKQSTREEILTVKRLI